MAKGIVVILEMTRIWPEFVNDLMIRKHILRNIIWVSTIWFHVGEKGMRSTFRMVFNYKERKIVDQLFSISPEKNEKKKREWI